MLTLLLSLAPAYAGFGQATLVDGAPEFSGCANGDPDRVGGCAWSFYHFLSSSLLTQGYTFQHVAVPTSALLQTEPGWLVGARLDTFPFGPPPENLSGKAENTQFSPVLPRLFVGRAGADRAASLALFPPIPVQGASALLLAADASQAWQRAHSRLGASADLTFARAVAPITASQEQYDDRDSFSNPDNLDPDTYAAVCGASENGCLDRFGMLSLGLRGGASWALGPVHPYALGGLAVVYERLYVMYDDTTWAMVALTPSAHAGLALIPTDRLTFTLGANAGLRTPGQTEDGSMGLAFKLDASAAWRF